VFCLLSWQIIYSVDYSLCWALCNLSEAFSMFPPSSLIYYTVGLQRLFKIFSIDEDFLEVVIHEMLALLCVPCHKRVERERVERLVCDPSVRALELSVVAVWHPVPLLV